MARRVKHITYESLWMAIYREMSMRVRVMGVRVRIWERWVVGIRKRMGRRDRRERIARLSVLLVLRVEVCLCVCLCLWCSPTIPLLFFSLILAEECFSVCSMYVFYSPPCLLMSSLPAIYELLRVLRAGVCGSHRSHSTGRVYRIRRPPYPSYTSSRIRSGGRIVCSGVGVREGMRLEGIELVRISGGIGCVGWMVWRLL
jgi:hypothetical protein